MAINPTQVVAEYSSAQMGASTRELVRYGCHLHEQLSLLEAFLGLFPDLRWIAMMILTPLLIGGMTWMGATARRRVRAALAVAIQYTCLAALYASFGQDFLVTLAVLHALKTGRSTAAVAGALLAMALAHVPPLFISALCGLAGPAVGPEAGEQRAVVPYVAPSLMVRAAVTVYGWWQWLLSWFF